VDSALIYLLPCLELVESPQLQSYVTDMAKRDWKGNSQKGVYVRLALLISYCNEYFHFLVSVDDEKILRNKQVNKWQL